ncbi:MAG TPA: SAM-dependent methyltransferase, partial [Cytophagales bacterium]|nr:SAM-dependent methyltransferase [Cytophagales bacterium]
TGNLIKPAPDYAKVTAFETNPVTARIVELIYPGVTVHTDYFESAFMQKPKLRSRMPGVSTWLPDAPFDLVIGNPPYGKHSSRYSGFFKKPKFTLVEHFFLYYGLQLLKPGGLLVFLTTAGWMRTGVAYQKAKEEVAKLARLENALHLPPVIEATNVPLDLLIFRRHEN